MLVNRYPVDNLSMHLLFLPSGLNSTYIYWKRHNRELKIFGVIILGLVSKWDFRERIPISAFLHSSLHKPLSVSVIQWDIHTECPHVSGAESPSRGTQYRVKWKPCANVQLDWKVLVISIFVLLFNIIPLWLKTRIRKFWNFHKRFFIYLKNKWLGRLCKKHIKTNRAGSLVSYQVSFHLPSFLYLKAWDNKIGVMNNSLAIPSCIYLLGLP